MSGQSSCNHFGSGLAERDIPQIKPDALQTGFESRFPLTPAASTHLSGYAAARQVAALAALSGNRYSHAGEAARHGGNTAIEGSSLLTKTPASQLQFRTHKKWKDM